MTVLQNFAIRTRNCDGNNLPFQFLSIDSAVL